MGSNPALSEKKCKDLQTLKKKPSVRIFLLQASILMSNGKDIGQHQWRNQRARKNQFDRANLYDFVFLMHVDSCDSDISNNQILSSKHFQKNQQTRGSY